MVNSGRNASILTARLGSVGPAVIGIILILMLPACDDSQKTASGETCAVPVSGSTSSSQTAVPASQLSPPAEQASVAQTETLPATALPRFLDLGTTTCRPCQMMIPVIEELRTKYSGKLQVDFINVSTNRAAGAQYNVRVIPLQIFFDPSGTELFRHTGYWPTNEIVNKWKELGYEFD
jgi:thioredoxin 1